MRHRESTLMLQLCPTPPMNQALSRRTQYRSVSICVHLWFSPLLQHSAKQRVQLDLEVGQDPAGQLAARAVERPFAELRLSRESVDFDLLLRRQDQPNLFDSCAGVSAQLRAVVIVAGDAYLNDDLGGGGMCGAVVFDRTANDREVGLGLRIIAGDRLLLLDMEP